MKRSALVTQVICDQLGDRLRHALPAGVELLPFTNERVLTEAERASIDLAFMSSDVIGTSSRDRWTPEMTAFCDALQRAPKLRWLQNSAAGVDRPIFGELAARGVRITTAAGAASETVALTAITGLLALSRRIPMWIVNQGAKRWQPLRTGELEPIELRGQTLLIVGCGPIGREAARLAKAFGLVVHGLRHSGPAALDNFDRVDGMPALPEAVATADWVLAACPLTPETTHLFDQRVFERFKPGAGFINIARGGVVDEPRLVEALQSGRVASAYLDVFEVEPLPADSPLWTMPNVILSSHSAGDTTGRHARIADIFLDNLARWGAGEALRNEVSFGR